MLTYKLTVPLQARELLKFPGLQGTSLLVPGGNEPILRLVFFASTVVPQRLGTGDLVICGESAFRNWPGKTALDLLEALVAVGGIGIAYDRGSIPADIEPPLRQRAAEQTIALLELPPVCSRVAIVDSVVFNRVLNEDTTLQPRERFYEDMIRASSRSGLQGIAVSLANLVRNPVVITDVLHRVMAYDQQDCDGWPLEDTLTSLVSPARMESWPNLFADFGVDHLIHHVPVQLNGGGIVEAMVIPIADDLNCMGYLYVLEVNKQRVSNQIQAINLHQIKQAAVVAYLELGRDLTRKRQEKHARLNFAYNLIFSASSSTETVAEPAHFHKFNLDAWHRVVYIRMKYPRPGVLLEQTEDYLENKACRLFPHSLVCNLENQILLFLECPPGKPETGKEQIAKMALSVMERFPPRQVRELQAGVGMAKPGLEGLRESYRQAKVAASCNAFPWGSRLQFYEDLGLLKLLSVLPQEAAQEYIRDTLGPLLEYDRQNSTPLLPTLVHHLLKTDLNINLTAKGLFLHPNTVRYRLHKTEEVLGRKLESFQETIDLYTAVRLALLWNEPRELTVLLEEQPGPSEHSPTQDTRSQPL